MPAEDSTQVKRLREAGAVIIGKTNLHELAMGITTISSLGGQTRNPYDLRRNPGGSSGGTGAAVAANLVAAGLGSDTCGSIRIPASHGSLIGLRVTLGLTSRAGVLPLSHSQDVVGPIARTVTDAAVLLQVMAGPDARDEATRGSAGRVTADYREALRGDALTGARIGVLRSMFGDAAEDREAGNVVQAALDQMKKLGAETFDVSVPGLDEMLRANSLIDSEFRFDFEDYLRNVPNPPVHTAAEILQSGLYGEAIEGVLRRRAAAASRETDAYRRARIRRDAVKQAVLALFEEQRLDAIAYPTMRRKPALVGESQGGSTCQLSASTGMPALAMPAGFTADRLPIGVEMLGRPFDESRLLGLAYSFEQKTHVRQPPFSTPALAAGGVVPAPVQFVAAGKLPAGASTGALTVRFTFDRTTGELRYDAAAAGVAPEESIGASIHRSGPGETGAALHQLLRPGSLRQAGTIDLGPVEQDALREGKLYLTWHTRHAPAGIRIEIEKSEVKIQKSEARRPSEF
jgi:Asp-tRNA(Asn)/Glu-tRNA(Gln) amidotransferase A subunit family amidase